MDYKTIDGYVATFMPYVFNVDGYTVVTRDVTVSICRQIIDGKIPVTIDGTVIGRAVHVTYGETGATVFIELNCDGRHILFNPHVSQRV